MKDPYIIELESLRKDYLSLQARHFKLLMFVAQTTNDGDYLRWCIAQREADDAFINLPSGDEP